MPTMKIKGYDTIINCDWLGDGVYVIIGVEEEGHPEDAHFGTWVDAWLSERARESELRTWRAEPMSC